MKALIAIDDEFEDLTVFLPWYRLREEGYEVRIASPRMHILTGIHGYRIEPDTTIGSLNPAEFDLFLIPDGAAVERLRVREEAVDIARTFMQEGMRVAAVGHGSQLLISAGALDGRRVTCSPGIRDDVRAAGAVYRDEAVVLDGNLLTSRGREELPTFAQLMIQMLAPSVV